MSILSTGRRFLSFNNREKSRHRGESSISPRDSGYPGVRPRRSGAFAPHHRSPISRSFPSPPPGTAGGRRRECPPTAVDSIRPVATLVLFAGHTRPDHRTRPTHHHHQQQSSSSPACTHTLSQIVDRVTTHADMSSPSRRTRVRCFQCFDYC